MKSLDMKAFIGSDFDVESNISGLLSIWILHCSDHLSRLLQEEEILVRPRLNDRQVLDDYSKVLVNGLVWRVHYGSYNGRHIENGLTSITVKGIRDIIWLECIGLEDKPEWREESERLAMPLIKVEGE